MRGKSLSRTIRFAICVMFFVSSTIVRMLAAPPTPTKQQLENYAQHIWQPQDGLPDANIRAIAQSHDRYLWIGTTGGLLRFDGEKFVLYNHENTPALRVDNITSLLAAKDGSLWIGTAGGGLVRYNGSGFSDYSTTADYAGSFIRALLEDHEGKLWIGTLDGLFLMTHDHIKRVDEEICKRKLNVFSMIEDHTGAIWVGGTALLRIRNQSADEFKIEDKAQTAIESILESSDGTLWVGTYTGLFKAQRSLSGDPGKFSRIVGIAGTVRALRQMPDDSLWIGAVNQGLFSYDKGSLKQLVLPLPLPNNAIFSIVPDEEENLWIGTLAGLVRLSKTGVSVISLPDTVDSDSQTIYSDPEGAVWVASAHLFRWQKDRIEQIKFPGMAGVHVLNVLRDREGALWMGTEGQGVFCLRKGHIVHYTSKQNLLNEFIRALLQTQDGSLWIGTASGLYRWHDDIIEGIPGSAGSGIHALREDRAENLWIGADQGLYLLREGSFVSNSVTAALQHKTVWSILEDSEGGLWFSTDGSGLFHWKAGQLKNFTTANGLLSNKIYQVLEGPKSRLWMSSPNGIFAVARNDLEAAAGDPLHRPAVSFYGTSDGLLSTQMLGSVQPAGAISSDGSIWFPSVRGPIRISPTYASHASETPVVVQNLIVDGREFSAAKDIELGASTSMLEVHYGAIQLRSQSNLRFRYKLEGFDEKWVEAGTRRVAYYTNLSPRRYVFRVAVYDLGSPGIVSEASFNIEKRPHFYQTLWFYACCAVIAIAIAWTIHWVKTRSLRGKFQAVMQERTRVAREVHDTLLQGCASVSGLLEGLSATKTGLVESERTLLNTARSQVISIIAEARQAIWDLREDDLQQSDIAGLLREVVGQAEKRFPFPFHYRVVGEPFRIHQGAAHQLLMVVREALFNAGRHANPTEVRLTVTFIKNYIQIEIEDDGQGLRSDQEFSSKSGKHYGMAGMRERIENLGGNLTIESSRGLGTRLKITAPLARFRIRNGADGRHASI